MRFHIGRWLVVFTIMIMCLGWSGWLFTSAVLAADSTPQPANNNDPASATPAPFVAPQFTISPVGNFKNQWFDVSMEPGSRIELVARIKNSGTVPAKLNTFATNALNSPNGGFSAANADDKPTGATLWLRYPDESFTLAPKQERQVKFIVSVPHDTAAGFYVAALVAQTADSLEIPGSTNFRQIIRSTISVEITVPGKMTSGFKLGTPEFSKAGPEVQLDVPITNTGTSRLRPEGTLTVTTLDGKKVTTSPIKMGSFYGGYTTSVRVLLPGQIPDGTYLVSLQLKDTATDTSASIKDVKTTLAEPKKADAPPPFVIDQASVTPSGSPIQYADVAATVANNGQLIPTANVTLDVKRDGQEVEQYPLAQNQALPTGQTKISQRYIPKDGWKPGKWTFQIVVSAVSIGTGTQTVLATVDVPGAITIP